MLVWFGPELQFGVSLAKVKLIEKYEGNILFLFELSSKSKKVENWRSVMYQRVDYHYTVKSITC